MSVLYRTKVEYVVSCLFGTLDSFSSVKIKFLSMIDLSSALLRLSTICEGEIRKMV